MPVEFFQGLTGSKSRPEILGGKASRRKVPTGLRSRFSPWFPFPGSLPPQPYGLGGGREYQSQWMWLYIPRPFSSTWGLQLEPDRGPCWSHGTRSLASPGGPEPTETPFVLPVRLALVVDHVHGLGIEGSTRGADLAQPLIDLRLLVLAEPYSLFLVERVEFSVGHR